MAANKDTVQSTDAPNVDDGDFFIHEESSNVRNRINVISNIILPPLPSQNLPSTSAFVEVLAAPTTVRPATIEGRSTGDELSDAGTVVSGSILRTYLTTGRKIYPSSPLEASVDQANGGDGTLPDLGEFDLDGISFSQCTAGNISLSALDELIASELNCEEVPPPSVVNKPLVKPPSEGALSEDEFAPVVGPPAGKGKVRFFKGRVPAAARPLKKRSSEKRSLKRCKSIISIASSEGVLSEDEFETPVETKRVRKGKGHFSKGRLIASSSEKRPSEESASRRCNSVSSHITITSSDGAVSEDESASIAGCSQATSVFSQQSDRETLRKFKVLQKATAENIERLAERDNYFDNSLQNGEARMSTQGALLERAQQTVEEARLNLQRAMATLEVEQTAYNTSRDDVQVIRQDGERCKKELARARKKYERLRW